MALESELRIILNLRNKCVASFGYEHKNYTPGSYANCASVCDCKYLSIEGMSPESYVSTLSFSSLVSECPEIQVRHMVAVTSTF